MELGLKTQYTVWFFGHNSIVALQLDARGKEPGLRTLTESARHTPLNWDTVLHLGLHEGNALLIGFTGFHRVLYVLYRLPSPCTNDLWYVIHYFEFRAWAMVQFIGNHYIPSYHSQINEIFTHTSWFTCSLVSLASTFSRAPTTRRDQAPSRHVDFRAPSQYMVQLCLHALILGDQDPSLK